MRCGCTPARPGRASAGFPCRVLPLDRMCGPAAKGRGERLSEREALSCEQTLRLQALARRRSQSGQDLRAPTRGSSGAPERSIPPSWHKVPQLAKSFGGPIGETPQSGEHCQGNAAFATLAIGLAPTLIPALWRVAWWRASWRFPSLVSNPVFRCRGRARRVPRKSFLCAAPTVWEARNRACA